MLVAITTWTLFQSGQGRGDQVNFEARGRGVWEPSLHMVSRSGRPQHCSCFTGTACGEWPVNLGRGDHVYHGELQGGCIHSESFMGVTATCSLFTSSQGDLVIRAHLISWLVFHSAETETHLRGPAGEPHRSAPLRPTVADERVWPCPEGDRQVFDWP